MTTYQKIINVCKEFADNHHVIQNFGSGELWQLADHDQTDPFKYTLMYMVDVPSAPGQNNWIYAFRVYFVTRVEAPKNRDGSPIYFEYTQAKSAMISCAQDFLSFWVQDVNYKMAIDFNSNISTFIDYDDDRVTGCSVDIRFVVPFTYDSCVIPMDGVDTPPTQDVAIYINDTLMYSVTPGSEPNIVVKDTNGDAVGSKVGVEWIVPAAGGGVASQTFNGSPVTDQPSGTTKAIVVQSTDPVQIGTTIVDDAGNLTIEVGQATIQNKSSAPTFSDTVSPEGTYTLSQQPYTDSDGVLKAEYYDPDEPIVCTPGIPKLLHITGQQTVYAAYDDGWRFQQGEYSNVILTDYYNLASPNEWGHNKRFTGDNGGYKNELTGTFHLADGTPTTQAGAFPNTFVRDYATRKRWYGLRSGTRTHADAISMAHTDVIAGETGFFLPSKADYEELSSSNISVGTYIDSDLFNWSAINMWSSTTDKTDTTRAHRYSPSSDGWTVAVKTQSNGGAYVKPF